MDDKCVPLKLICIIYQSLNNIYKLYTVEYYYKSLLELQRQTVPQDKANPSVKINNPPSNRKKKRGTNHT